MTDADMTVDRVLELIAAYGSEPGAWPEDERASAEALLHAQPDLFATALADARLIEQVLAAEDIPEPTPALADAILAQAPQPRPAQNGLWRALSDLLFPQGVRWPAGAALASLAMGLVGGYAYASTGAGYDQADSAYFAAFGLGNGADWISLE